MASLRQILEYIIKTDVDTAKVANYTKQWGKLRDKIHELERTIKPLTGRIAQVTAAFASTAAIKKAIQLADFQIRQQVKLQVALGENAYLFEQQLERAAEFQKATLFTDELTLSIRAMGFSFGVANNEMDDFVRAASTLSALGLVPSLEAAARQLLFLRSGQGQPLSVVARLPGVKDLSEMEKVTGGVEKMINRLLGAVAEEVAKTPFGTLQRDINVINDEFERLGRILILIVGPAITRAKYAFQHFVSNVDRLLRPIIPLINALLVPLEGVLRKLLLLGAAITVLSVVVKIIDFMKIGIKGIASALVFLTGGIGKRAGTAFLKGFIGILKTIGVWLSRIFLVGFLPLNVAVVVIGAIVAIAVLLIAKVKVIRDVIGGLLIVVAAFFVALKEILVAIFRPLWKWLGEVFGWINMYLEQAAAADNWFGRFIRWLRNINDGIKDGSLIFRDVVDDVKLSILKAWNWFKNTIWNPLVALIEITITWMKAGFKTVWNVLQMSALVALSVVSEGVRVMVDWILEAIDGIMAALAWVVGWFDEETADAMRTNLGDAVEGGAWAEWNQNAAKAVKTLGEEIPAAWEAAGKMHKEILLQLAEEEQQNDKIIRQEEKRVEVAKDRRRLAQQEAKVAAEQATLERLAALREVRLEGERKAIVEILSLLSRRPALPTDALTQPLLETTGVYQEALEALGAPQTVPVLAEDMTHLEKELTGIMEEEEKRRLAMLEAQYEDRLITHEDYVAERLKLSRAAADREIRFRRKEFEDAIAVVRQELEARREVDEAVKKHGLQSWGELYNFLKEKQEELQDSIKDENRQWEDWLNATEDMRDTSEELYQQRQKAHDEAVASYEDELRYIGRLMPTLENGIRRLDNHMKRAKAAASGLVAVWQRLDMLLFELTRKRKQELEEISDLAADLSEKMSEAGINALKAREQDFAAAMAEAERNYAKAVHEWEELGRKTKITAEQTAQYMRDIAIARQGAFDKAAIEEAEKALADYNEEEERYNNILDARSKMVELGLMSRQQARQLQVRDLQTLRQLAEAQRQYLVEFRERLLAMEQFKQTAPETYQAIADALIAVDLKIQDINLTLQRLSDDFAGGFKAGLREWADEARWTFETGADFAKSAADTIATELTTAITDAARGVKSLKESFLDAAQAIVDAILEMIIKMLVFKALAGPLGMIGGANIGGQVTPFGFHLGGPVRRFAPGGLVPGGGPDRDSVPAMLTPREWVIRRTSADYYGNRIMSALNAAAIPRELLNRFGTVGSTRPKVALNTGGPVGAGASKVQVVPVLVAGEAQMETLLAGGGNRLIDYLRSHRDEFLGEDIARSG